MKRSLLLLVVAVVALLLVRLAGAGAEALEGNDATGDGEPQGTATASAAAPQVTLPCGTAVVGEYDKKITGLAAYRGIPFANPPVGAGRFMPAEPMLCPPSNPFQATKNGPVCHQSFNPMPQLASEDCLHINVFVNDTAGATATHSPQRSSQARAQEDTKLKPVLFWVYGGSNVAGSNTFYLGLENLAQHVDICIIAPNYRLSALGYLASSALAAQDPRNVSGNYGLTDIVAALKWVQANAAAFGCDPNAVTIYGQSSGGTNILALMASEHSKGLFHAAISLSASPNITRDLAATEKGHLPYLLNTPCAPHVKDGNATALANCLRTAPVKDLMAAVPDSWDTDPESLRPQTKPGPISPVGLIAVDGVTVTMPVTKAFANGLIDIPVYLSSMRDEGDLMPNATVDTWAKSDLITYIQQHYKSYPKGVVDTLLSLYTDNPSDDVADRAYYDMGTDFGLSCGFAHLASAAAKSFQSPVYLVRDELPPTTPFTMILGNVASKYAFHMWDYMKIHEAWDLPAIMGSPAMKPSARDIQGGQLLRAAILDIVTKHSTDRLAAVKPGSSFPITNVLQPDKGTNATASLIQDSSFKQSTCEKLAAAGFGREYEWIN